MKTLSFILLSLVALAVANQRVATIQNKIESDKELSNLKLRVRCLEDKIASMREVEV